MVARNDGGVFMARKKAPEGSFEEKINNIRKNHTRLKNSEPFLSSTWWEVPDVPVEELREYAAKHRLLEHFEFHKQTQTMQLQLTNMPLHVTVFAYSVKVKVKQHIVDAFAYENA
jgi:hypothetical protein